MKLEFSSSPEGNQRNSSLKVGRIAAPDTFAVLLLDIDHFGQYNDNFGHPAGDDLLREIARTLQAVTRDTDVPARLECAVFAVLLPQTSMQGAVTAAERLRARIAATPGKQPISVSIGVASKKVTTRSVEQVMHEAEQALAVSKKLGQNRVIHFDLTMAATFQTETSESTRV